VENSDSNYGSESNLDSCSSTIHFNGINHISKINIDLNVFLREPNTLAANTDSTGIDFDFNSNDSLQSFSTTQTFADLRNVNVSSLARISNNQLRFNGVYNYSMNLSTFQPQVEEDDEDNVEENEEEEVEQEIAVAVMTKRKRGRPPLTQDEKAKSDAKKAEALAAKKAIAQAAKRAKNN
jgi:hypothetical protein